MTSRGFFLQNTRVEIVQSLDCSSTTLFSKIQHAPKTRVSYTVRGLCGRAVDSIPKERERPASLPHSLPPRWPERRAPSARPSRPELCRARPPARAGSTSTVSRPRRNSCKPSCAPRPRSANGPRLVRERTAWSLRGERPPPGRRPRSSRHPRPPPPRPAATSHHPRPRPPPPNHRTRLRVRLSLSFVLESERAKELSLKSNARGSSPFIL